MKRIDKLYTEKGYVQRTNSQNGHVKVPFLGIRSFCHSARKFPELIKQAPGSVDVSNGINETGEIDNKRTENM